MSNVITYEPAGPAAHRIPAWAKPAALAAAVVIFVALGASNYYRAAVSDAHRSDFSVCHAAGRAVLDGTNLYEAHNPRGWYYMYLPVFAVAMVPLALLPVGVASLLWYLLSVAMMAHGVVLSLRLARAALPRSRIIDLPAFWPAALTVAVVGWPTWSGLLRGQVSWLLAYLMVAAVYLMHRRRPVAAGACLAWAIAMKVFPALMLAYFVFRARWTMAAATVLWLVVFVLAIPSAVFGPAGNAALLMRWASDVGMQATNPEEARGSERYMQMVNPHLTRNQSFQAMLIRGATNRRDDDAPRIEAAMKRVALAVGVAMLLATAWACGWRAPADPARLIPECAIVMLLCLLLSPVSWVHNYVLMALPGALALAATMLPEDPDARRTFGRALLAYGLGSVLALSWERAHSAGALMWGAFVLWGAFAWEGWRSRVGAEARNE